MLIASESQRVANRGMDCPPGVMVRISPLLDIEPDVARRGIGCGIRSPPTSRRRRKSYFPHDSTVGIRDRPAHASPTMNGGCLSMHAPCRKMLPELPRIALSMIVLSSASLTTTAVAAVEPSAAEVAEAPLFEIIVTARKRPQVLDEVP